MSTGIRQKVTQDQWENERERVIDVLDNTMGVQFKLAKGRPVSIVVEHYKEIRTDAQNRFMWPLLRAIGNAAGESDEERVKRHMLTAWAGERYEVVMGVKQQVYPRTHKFTVKQMVNFCEFLRAEAANTYGITPPVPGDYLEWARGAK